MTASEKSYDVEQRLNALAARGPEILPCSAQLSLSSSMQTVPGLAAALSLDAGGNPQTYRIHAQVLINPTGSGGTLTYRIHPTGGLTASNGRQVITEMSAGSAPNPGTLQVAEFANIDVTFTAPGTIGGGLADRIIWYDGIFIVTVAGTLNIQVALSSGSGLVYQYGTYLETTLVS